MELSALKRTNLSSPYAEQLSNGFGKLKFAGALEKEFREYYVTQTLPRGRLAGLVALMIVLAFMSVDWIFGSPGSGSMMNTIRLSVLCPLLVMLVVATYLPSFERFYMEVATVGVTAIGLIVTYMCLRGAMEGASYVLGGTVLVNLYASLFLGLFFYRAALIASLLVAAHLVIGFWLGLPTQELFYSTAMLGTAAVIGTSASFNLEHALRMSFLEARLLNELAERDGLTGLYNRRIFDDLMRRVWRQSRREGLPVQIIFIDIDYFKIYNDLYGHQHGDDCLKRVARTIAHCAKRPFDFCARYGGEEFVLVLYGPPLEFDHSVPERIRQEIAGLAIPHEGSAVAKHVTVSIGVALAQPSSGRSLAGAIHAADDALYEAKRLGRDRVVLRDADISDVETGNFRVHLRELA
jgi:diguanylate cyclase (GGDEF)-like protein